MKTRRGFLGAMLAAAAAPALVRAGSIMPVYVPKPGLITLWGDGIHDDTTAMQALLSGGEVNYGGASVKSLAGTLRLPSGTFLVSAPLVFGGSGMVFDGARNLITAQHDGPMMTVAEEAKHLTVQNWHFERRKAA